MRITKLSIKNYKSFNDTAGTISFYGSHSLFVGKNNAGKSNIFSALNLLLGTKNPNYIKIEEADFFDTTKPIEIDLTIGGITGNDKNELFGLPNLTKQQKGALSSKNLDDIEINFSFQHYFQNGVEDLETEESEVGTETEQRQQFEIKLWGFTIHRKIEDIRFALIKMLKVPAVR
jgi:predicted ATP-dependent endonuclease of OLD family